jgi:hypothetical protein
MVFEPTLNIGTLVVALTIVFSAGGFYAVSRVETRRTREDIGNIRTDLSADISDIKADLKALNKVIVDVALQNQRLDNQSDRINSFEKRFDERMGGMDRRWEELRRGEGMVLR